MQSLIQGVFDFAVCSSRTHVYAIGGKTNQQNVCNLVQCYEIKSNSWRLLQPCRVKRYAHTAAVLRETGRIFLFGGRGVDMREMVKETEEYSQELNSWSLLPEMPQV